MENPIEMVQKIYNRNEMIVAPVKRRKYKNRKYISIPKRSNLKVGDMVIIKRHPIGNISIWNERKPQHLYFIYNRAKNIIKIGISNDPVLRRVQLQASSPDKLEVLAVLEKGASIEKMVHDIFKEYRIRGEWFEYSDEIRGFIDMLEISNANAPPTPEA